MNKNSHDSPNLRAIPLSGLDPFAVFRHIAGRRKDAFFFEASEEIGKAPRTSLIGIGPFETLVKRAGRSERIRENRREPLPLPFFEALEEMATELRQRSASSFPYAHGGLFGLVGYETVSGLEPSLLRKSYFDRAERSENAMILHARRLIVFEHEEQRCYLVDSSKEGIEELGRFLADAPAPISSTFAKREMDSSRLSPTLGAEGYEKGVAKIKEHIRRGDVFQAVLAERFECEVRAAPMDIFAALRETSPAPYSFYFPLPEGAFFGASPEPLLRSATGRIQTFPIAGTRPRGTDAAGDRRMARQLSRSQKEAAEHVMLVDLARNDLGRVARPGSVAVKSFRSLKRFSHVMHLVSEVTAELASGLTSVDAFKACFPAGTLSGAPKVRAMELLADIEPQARGFYGGAVVALGSRGDIDSCIAIRCAELRGTRAILRAGAGIVADSRANHEYAEVNNKLRALRIAIGSAEAAVREKHS